MAQPNIPVWKKAPFVRLLVSLATGILLQWYLQFPLVFWQLACLVGLIVSLLFFFAPVFTRYRFGAIAGLGITATFISSGAISVWHHDIRNHPGWFGKLYNDGDTLVVTLTEHPVEKANSYKANADVNYIFQKGLPEASAGKIILYFSKDSPLPVLTDGSEIVIKKPLTEIKNTGNPGSFDYKRSCLFQQLTHQVYLQPDEFAGVSAKNEKGLALLINNLRSSVLAIIRDNIPGEKEKGLAEALLIGYKDDLDKTLVQSYTNTGVVHIIAISGLHLGLVYWLLVLLSKPLQRKKHTKWLKPVLVITGLWLFTLLAGAQPSVLRSAVMFTGIVLGESLGRKSSVYNGLAASAFLLLCYNPFWLWDVGFQLSYTAVLSIVIFNQPVYNWFFIKNKLLDFSWKMTAVTLAAQVLTVPFIIYHFHQFPTFFLLTNFIAVPLSSLIVLGEILLCIIFFMPPLALLVGRALAVLIGLMNSCVERMEMLPFSVWGGLQINLFQAVLLSIAITTTSFWLLKKQPKGLLAALVALLTFVALRSISFINASGQQKIIVYNVPHRQAIDLISGRNYFFIGDSSLNNDDVAKNFYLNPARILNRVSESPPSVIRSPDYFAGTAKHILLLDKTMSFFNPGRKDSIDLLIVSKNPTVRIPELVENLAIKQVVFDASMPSWKTKYWKSDCDSLHVPWYDVSEKGAFVMNLR